MGNETGPCPRALQKTSGERPPMLSNMNGPIGMFCLHPVPARLEIGPQRKRLHFALFFVLFYALFYGLRALAHRCL